VRITFDPAKRETNLQKHGLDLADAGEVLAGRVVTLLDAREDYGEDRYQTFGHLGGRLVMAVWTPRGDDERRIISMRKANDREQAQIGQRLGEGGRDDG
jgi:uncharacterized DUF497 family protein